MRGVIRTMEERDRAAVLEMMRTFYASPAVWSGGSEEIFRADFARCVSESPDLEGYVVEDGPDLLGYAMAACSFSTEFGRPCVWIEDLYIKDGARGLGIGSRLLRFLEARHPDALFRLEVERENEGAVRLYQAHGYDFLPYAEMKKLPWD